MLLFRAQHLEFPYAHARLCQLPLGLLSAAQGHPMLVELKNGETLNGHLVQCDTWMNLTLKGVVQTSPVRCSLPAGRSSARGRWREAAC